MKKMSQSQPRSHANQFNFFKDMSDQEIIKCQRNIYSDEDELSDDDLEIDSFGSTLKNRNRLFGVYK